MINKIAKIRVFLIALFFGMIFSILLSHIYLLQIIKHPFFCQLGQQQYQVLTKTIPKRAPIFDKNNKLIATEKPMPAIFITPDNLKNRESLIQFLSEQYPHILKKLLSEKSPHFMYIARNISDAELSAIDTLSLPDIYVLQEPGRYYPLACLSPVLGRTDIDNNGIGGLELIYNKTLAGEPAYASIEKDARSGHYYFNKKIIKSGVAGTPIYSTIDSTLQFLAYEELKETVNAFQAKEGAVVIMDPVTGALYVMAMVPNIDPQQSIIDDVSLLKNRIVTETYEFGSVMKTFLALAALEEKAFTPTDVIDCENTKNGIVNGKKFTTWKAHGLLTLSEIIEYSNNIGTAKIAQTLGKKVYEHYRKCGFGQPTGLNFPGQQKGYITHPKTWSKASLNSLSFGYEIRATLLQLARAFSLFSNGGYLPIPQLTYPLTPPPDKEKLYSPESIMHMRTILEKTCTQGTGHAAVIPGVTVLGKTGTARLLDGAGNYSPLKNIYTFTGIVEKGNYKRVIVTFIKEAARHDLYASGVAAPLFERIAQKMLIHDKMI